jgi:hypothetical protein
LEMESGFFIEDIRDGVPPKWTGKPPTGKVPQRLDPDPATREKMKLKLLKMFRKGHVERELILALMNFFSVAMGENDIRMVFDGTKSGLNDVLWAPWFALPTVDTTLRKVVTGTWM